MDNPNDQQLESLLDTCIEEMLQGRDWEDAVSPATAVELGPLMHIAGELRQGGEAHALNSGYAERIWERISRVLKYSAQIRIWRPGLSASSTLRPALA